MHLQSCHPGSRLLHFHPVWLTALLCIRPAGPCLPWDGNLQVVWLASCKTDPLGQGDKNDGKVQRELIRENVEGTGLKGAPRPKGTAQEWLQWLPWVAGLCTALLLPFGMQDHAGTVSELSGAFRNRGSELHVSHSGTHVFYKARLSCKWQGKGKEQWSKSFAPLPPCSCH